MSDVIDFEDKKKNKSEIDQGDIVWQCSECGGIEFLLHKDGWVQCSFCSTYASNLSAGETND